MTDPIQPPSGYTLDHAPAQPPAGYKLDEQHTVLADDAPSLTGFIKNLFASGGNMAADLYGSVRHPVDTLEGLAKVIMGGAGRGFQTVGLESRKDSEMSPQEQESLAAFDGLVKHFKDRYGSLDAVKETAYRDPAGLAADLSMVLGGAGEMAEAGNLGRTSRALKTGAAAANPLTVPSMATSRLLQTLPNTAAANGLRDALNRAALRGGFSTLTDAAKVDNAVVAMGEGSVPFSDAGLEQSRNRGQQLQAVKRTMTQYAPGDVDQTPIELKLDEISRNRWNQPNPQGDVKQVEKVRQNWRERTGGLPMNDPNTGKPIKDRWGNPMFTEGLPLSVDEAETLKEGTYANNKYGSEVPPHLAATNEAEKAIGYMLKTDLEKHIPELQGLNDDIAKQIDLQGILEDALNKYKNQGKGFGSLKEAFSTGKLIATGLVGSGGAVAAHSPALAAAGPTSNLVYAALSNPVVQTKIAIAINKAQQWNPNFAGKATMANAVARVREYMKSLQQDGQQ